MVVYPLIVVNGRPNSGKDTFISLVSNILESGYNITSKHMSSIDIIKDAGKLLGWDGCKNSRDRKFLSKLKELSIWYNNYPFTKVMDFYDLHSHRNVVFTQVREVDEIMKLKDSLVDMCLTVLLRSNRSLPYDNSSDFYCEEGEYDVVIDNNGSIEDLVKYCTDTFVPFLIAFYLSNLMHARKYSGGIR